jgi:Transposase, Mutator family
MTQVTGVAWEGRVKMTTVGIGDEQFKLRGDEISGGEAGPVVAGGAGLVLPDEVVADLAGQLVARARAGEPVALTGRDGLLAGLIGQVLQAGLALEMEDHLGGGGGNGRNGYRAKTLSTEAGPVTVSVPRDRAGTFEPALIPKGSRRTAGISDTVISLYASVILSFRVSRGCDLRCRVVDSVADGTLAA